MSSKNYHLFHLVNPSPWPLIVSIGTYGLTTGSALYFHFFSIGSFIALTGLLTVIYGAFIWWRDVVREGTFEGCHTTLVQNGLRLGIVLFIVSEVMFFSGFFWAFFHSSLAPAIELGSVWPPIGIDPFYAWDVPFLNTLVLLLSGSTITWAHFALAKSLQKNTLISLYLTILLAVFFTFLQACEYTEATFSIADSVYGTTFFMATGFHGFHVIVGTIFIVYTTVRVLHYHLTAKHHVGFLGASWYWHFVDVVWLFLFISIYWWGNTTNSGSTFLINT